MAPNAVTSAVALARAAAGGDADATPVDGPPSSMSKDARQRAYRDMLLVRRFEEKAGQLYSLGAIGGFCHLCIGQEAVVVGVQMALQVSDQVVATHRNHGQLLALGIDPKALMAELTGRQGGLSGGKGGSMHPFAKDKRFYGGHGIVGSSAPIAAGIAFANRYRDNRAVCVGYMGDGASYQGQVAEAFNLAAAWALPVVFVIENNDVSSYTHIQANTSRECLAQRGAPFGIPGCQVDGMDVEAVVQAMQVAAAHARVGYGPYILEMQTCRYRGHSMSDPDKYAATAEQDAQPREQTDPLLIARARLLEAGQASEDELKLIDRDVRNRVNSAASFARDDAEPDVRTLAHHVYL